MNGVLRVDPTLRQWLACHGLVAFGGAWLVGSAITRALLGELPRNAGASWLAAVECALGVLLLIRPTRRAAATVILVAAVSVATAAAVQPEGGLLAWVPGSAVAATAATVVASPLWLALLAWGMVLLAHTIATTDGDVWSGASS